MVININTGNPPFNKPRRKGRNNKTGNLYPDFAPIFASSDISIFVLPCRWLDGHLLKSFREKMINEYGLKYIKKIHKNPFLGTHIEASVCYVICEKNYKGLITLEDDNGHCISKQFTNVISFVDEEMEKNIIKKIKEKTNESIQKIWYQRQEIKTNDYRINEIKGKPILTAKGLKYIKEDHDLLNSNFHLNKFKTVFSYTTTNYKKGYGKEFIIEPGTYINMTYVYFPHNTKKEAINCQEYLHLEPIIFLKNINHFNINFTKECFKYVPLVDFSVKWTKEKFYEFFNITDEQIKYIKSQIN